MAALLNFAVYEVTCSLIHRIRRTPTNNQVELSNLLLLAELYK